MRAEDIRRCVDAHRAGEAKSVADQLRREDREALLALPPGERVALALALGERDFEAFRKARRPELTRDEAARLLERQRQAGRRPSPGVEALIECRSSLT